MSQYKQRAVKLLERATGARVVRPGALSRLYEQEFLAEFLSFFMVDAVFDVGANAGQYAQILRQRAGFRGHIISCEPIPAMADELRRLATDDPMWHVEEVALTMSAGTAAFNVMNESQFSSLLQPATDEFDGLHNANAVKQVITVKTETMRTVYDSYRQMLGFSRPFLKMDTQGHDHVVVQGAGDRLAGFVGMQSELAIRRLYEGSLRFTDSLAFYEDKGFVLSALFPNNAGHFPDMLEVDCIMYRPEHKPR